MDWRKALELELEVVVADALQDGPADDAAVARVRRNITATIERWFAEKRIPFPVVGYRLHVEGGRGLTIQLEWEEAQTPKEVRVDTRPRDR